MPARNTSKSFPIDILLTDTQTALKAWRQLVVENHLLRQELHRLSNLCTLLEQQKGEKSAQAQQVPSEGGHR